MGTLKQIPEDTYTINWREIGIAIIDAIVLGIKYLYNYLKLIISGTSNIDVINKYKELLMMVGVVLMILIIRIVIKSMDKRTREVLEFSDEANNWVKKSIVNARDNAINCNDIEEKSLHYEKSYNTGLTMYMIDTVILVAMSAALINLVRMLLIILL